MTPNQQRVAAAGVIRGIVVPADVIAGARVEIQRIGVRIIAAARPADVLPPDRSSHAIERRRAIQLGDERRETVDGVAADAAALLMARQIIAVHRCADRGNRGDQLRRDLGRQEISAGTEKRPVRTYSRRKAPASRGESNRDARPTRLRLQSPPRLSGDPGRHAAISAQHTAIVDHHPDGKQRRADRRRDQERHERVAERHQRQQVQHILGLEAAQRGLPAGGLADHLLDAHAQKENQRDGRTGHQAQHRRRQPLASVAGLRGYADADRNEQQDRHRGIAGQIIQMPDPAALAAHARQLAVGVIQKIRQNQQQRRQIRPAIGPGQKRRRGRQAHRQAHRGQMIGRDPAVIERRDQAARQSASQGRLPQGRIGQGSGFSMRPAYFTPDYVVIKVKYAALIAVYSSARRSGPSTLRRSRIGGNTSLFQSAPCAS